MILHTDRCTMRLMLVRKQIIVPSETDKRIRRLARGAPKRDGGIQDEADHVDQDRQTEDGHELEEDVDVVGISILSGSHLELVPEVVDRLRAAGSEAPVVVGGIIPPEDAEILLGKGVARVYTPKDFEIGHMMDDMLRLVEGYRAGLVA